MAKRKVIPRKKKVASQSAAAAVKRKKKHSPRDKKTLDAITSLATGVVTATKRKRDPHVDIPSRTLSNVHYSARKRIIEMGKNTNRRQLFNLSQAKAYMQTMLVANGCKELIEEDVTTSIRGLYYKLKHTIPGTNENTFDDQAESDPIIEDIEVLINSLREELHLFAQKRGDLVGDITIVDSGGARTCEVDCSNMGMGGYGIPSIVEPEVIKFKNCKAKFILHVEKAAVWQRFNEDDFWRKHNCLLTHGAGQPTRGVRRLLYRLNNELKLPVYCLLDNDPWGYYIYSVMKQGSINLAYESRRMAIPGARFMGLRSKDFERCELNPSVTIKLSESDKKRTRQIASYPWFEKKRDWQKELKLMLDNDFKLEVESLISKDISYVTEEYVPQRLKDRDFLD